MSDLIDRQAAIDGLIRKMRPHNNGDGTITICAMSEGLVVETLNDLPPARSWIPVTEMLPEDGIAVLVTTENEEVYIDQVITDPYKERYFQNNTAYDNFQVIAWQPLPEPYKGD